MTALVGFGVFAVAVLIAWMLSRAGVLSNSKTVIMRNIDAELKKINRKSTD